MDLAAHATAESGATTPRRVVVIGGGPAAHRFAEAMHARSRADPDSRSRSR